MTEFDATEQAFKNGYTSGLRKAKYIIKQIIDEVQNNQDEKDMFAKTFILEEATERIDKFERYKQKEQRKDSRKR